MCFNREISYATSSLHGHNVTAPAAKMADPCSLATASPTDFSQHVRSRLSSFMRSPLPCNSIISVCPIPEDVLMTCVLFPEVKHESAEHGVVERPSNVDRDYRRGTAHWGMNL